MYKNVLFNIVRGTFLGVFFLAVISLVLAFWNPMSKDAFLEWTFGMTLIPFSLIILVSLQVVRVKWLAGDKETVLHGVERVIRVVGYLLIVSGFISGKYFWIGGPMVFSGLVLILIIASNLQRNFRKFIP